MRYTHCKQVIVAVAYYKGTVFVDCTLRHASVQMRKSFQLLNWKSLCRRKARHTTNRQDLKQRCSTRLAQLEQRSVCYIIVQFITVLSKNLPLSAGTQSSAVYSWVVSPVHS